MSFGEFRRLVRVDPAVQLRIAVFVAVLLAYLAAVIPALWWFVGQVSDG